MSFTYPYPRPSLTVDVVVFGLDMTDPPTLNVLLIRRTRPGTVFENCWALPGGFVDENEDLEVAARRELREETQAEPRYIEQLATFGRPGRDPRGHVVSVAYMALVQCNAMSIQGGDDAGEACWWPVKDIEFLNLAFDHSEILNVALKRLRAKVRWHPVGIDLLPLTFPLSDLQKVYETILDRKLDKRNFRRKILSYGVLVEAASVRVGNLGRSCAVYRFDQNAYNALLERGAYFEV